MADKNQIIIDVELDDQKLPERIYWAASQGGEAQLTKAFFLSLFDPQRKDTLKIDLWTKDMNVNEMQVFTHNTLKAMGRSYAKAVNDASAVAKFDALADALFEDKNV